MLTGTNLVTGRFEGIAGSFQADGSGNITAGVMDINNGGSLLTNLAVVGAYSVAADGRGTATLNSSTNPLNADFVLISSGQHGLVVRFDNVAAASGSIDLQNAADFSNAAIQGKFVLNLSGVDAVGSPMATVGMFSVDSTGNFSSGVEDLNDASTISNNVPVTGFMVIGASNGRGTANLTTPTVASTFVVYIVDSTHVKFLETDSAPILAGDGFNQQGTFSSSSLSGAYAFTLGGTSSSGPFVAGGIFNANGGGNITSGVEDINNNGAIALNLMNTGTYSLASNGRGTLTLSNGSGSFNFVIYASNGGFQMLETDSHFVTSGAALLQQSSGFSNASLQANYGLNFTGVINGVEVDSIAQFLADGRGGLSGTIDFNIAGGLERGLKLAGTYTVGTDGRGTLQLQSSNGSQSMTLYIISSSQMLFAEMNANVQAVGILARQ